MRLCMRVRFIFADINLITYESIYLETQKSVIFEHLPCPTNHTKAAGLQILV